MLCQYNIVTYIDVASTQHVVRSRTRSRLPRDLRIPVILSSLFPLQREILQHVTSVNDATYKALVKETGRDRVTILQSLKPLIKYRYIEERSLSPGIEKSTSIFSPTPKGYSYAWVLGLVDTRDITRIEKDDAIIDYVKFIEKTFTASQHKEILGSLFTELANGKLDYEEKNDDKKKELIKKSFRNALFELIQKEDFDFRFLSDNRTVEWLRKLYSVEELKMMKRHLTQIKTNLGDTIKRLPG